MGATPVPVSEIGRFAREFEASGWDGVAVGEAHGLLPDPYTTLAVAAAATTTLKVGTAVAVPLRHPLLAAGAMATVQGLSGGRARFCLGRGDGAVKVLRQKPMRVAEFEEYLRRLQGFLRRENVDLEGVPVSMARIDDLDPSLDVPRPPRRCGRDRPEDDRDGGPPRGRDQLLRRGRRRPAAERHRLRPRRSAGLRGRTRTRSSSAASSRSP